MFHALTNPAQCIPARRPLAGLPLMLLVALAISASVGEPAPAILGAAPSHGRVVLPLERRSVSIFVRRQQHRPIVARAAGRVGAVSLSAPTTAQPVAMERSGVVHHVRVERTSLPPPVA